MSSADPGSFSIKQFALVQYTANMLLTCIKRVSESIGDVDQADTVILSAFLLASMSDTIRLVIQSGSATSHIIADGLLSIASISDMTGIARQTVRRKCADLEARNILIREQSRLYRCLIHAHIVEEMIGQISGLMRLNDKII
jgi:hypothetical protein